MTGLETQRLFCKKCHTVFVENTLTYVTVQVWVAHVRSMCCPSCGAGHKHLAMGANVEKLRQEFPDLKVFEGAEHPLK